MCLSGLIYGSLASIYIHYVLQTAGPLIASKIKESNAVFIKWKKHKDDASPNC